MLDGHLHRALPRIWPSRVFYGWAIVCTGFFISIAQVPMYGPVFPVFVKPIEADLGWSRSAITLAFTVGSLGGSLLASAIGSTLDRYGARLIMSGAGVVAAAGLLGVAVMGEPWHFWIAYGAARAASVAGVGLGMSIAIANWFIPKRGRATALRSAGQRGGQAIVPLLILPVLLLMGWRESFMVFAAATLLFVAVPSLLFIRRRPEDHGLNPDGDAEADGDAGRPTGGRAAAPREYSWTLGQVRRTRTLWMLTLWMLTLGMSMGLAAQIAINVHAVANFQDKGVSEGLAVTVASVFTGVAALSMAGWGALLERIHVRYASMMAMSLFFVAMGVLLVADTYPLAVVFAVLFGLGTGGWTVSQMIMIPNYFGRLHAGSIKGFISPIEGLVGISGPLVAAFIYDTTKSYDAAFVGAAAVFAVGAGAFFLARPLRVPIAPPAPVGPPATVENGQSTA